MIFNDEKQDALVLRSGSKQECLLSLPLLNFTPEALSNAIKGKDVKGLQTGNKGIKLFLFHVGLVKKFPRINNCNNDNNNSKTLETNYHKDYQKDYRVQVFYNVNKQNNCFSTYQLYQLEIEIKIIIPSSQNIIHINLMKYVQSLYPQNYEVWMEKIRESQRFK